MTVSKSELNQIKEYSYVRVYDYQYSKEFAVVVESVQEGENEMTINYTIVDPETKKFAYRWAYFSQITQIDKI